MRYFSFCLNRHNGSILPMAGLYGAKTAVYANLYSALQTGTGKSKAYFRWRQEHMRHHGRLSLVKSSFVN